MRIPFWTLPALILIVLAATLSFACGGDLKDDTSVRADVFPTATIPSTLPAPIIVSGTPRPQSARGRYVVQDGDSPSSIAARFDVSLDELLSVNNIIDPTGLHVGDELIIPGSGATPEPQPTAAAQATSAPAAQPTAQPTSGSIGEQAYTVQDGDNPASIAAQFGITAQELMDANGITDPTSLLIGDVLTIPAP